jgi:hypothetical protein
MRQMRLYVRRCVNNGRRGWDESASGCATVTTGAEDFEQVAVDLEVVFTRQGVSQIGDRTGVERNGSAAPGADEVMAVNRRAGHVDRSSRSIQNTGEHTERGKDLQRSIDRRAAALASSACRIGDNLLSRKWPLPL